MALEKSNLKYKKYKEQNRVIEYKQDLKEIKKDIRQLVINGRQKDYQNY